jgi:hypothetical protein
MDKEMNPEGSGKGRRVFVLVDGDKSRGVFLTWEAAENFADRHRFSLDGLMEYGTSADHPDDLLLMAADHQGKWEFAGHWNPRKWGRDEAPRRVRLDHYRFQHGVFILLRQREFDWDPEALDKLDPMNPDTGKSESAPGPAVRRPAAARKWSPELGSLKPPAHPDPGIESRAEQQPGPEPEPGRPPEPESPAVTDKPLPPPPPRPTPAPSSHRPVSAPVSAEETRLYEELDDAFADDEEASQSPVPLRLLVAILALIAGWAYGIYGLYKPEPSLSERIAVMDLPDGLTVFPIEPDRVFVSLGVPQAEFPKWIRQLDLDAIPMGQSHVLPRLQTLNSWPVQSPADRVPRNPEGVAQWSETAFDRISTGYVRRTDNGEIWILHQNANRLLGWIDEADLKTVFAPDGRK